MTLARYQGPGHGVDLPLLRSGVRPETTRVRSRRARSSTAKDAQAPRYASFVAGGRAKDIYTLTYNGLTSSEAVQLVLEYSTLSKRGTAAVLYSPDDRSEPIEVLMLARPSVTTASPQLATVVVTLEQQR